MVALDPQAVASCFQPHFFHSLDMSRSTRAQGHEGGRAGQLIESTFLGFASLPTFLPPLSPSIYLLPNCVHALRPSPSLMPCLLSTLSFLAIPNFTLLCYLSVSLPLALNRSCVILRLSVSQARRRACLYVHGEVRDPQETMLLPC